MYKKFRLTEIGVAEIAIALFLIVLPCLENVDSCIKGTIAGVIWFAGTTLALGILISGKRRLVFSYPDIWVCVGFLLYGVYGWLGKHPVDTIILWNTLALCGTYLLAGNVSRWDVVILACFVAVIIQSIWGIGQQFCLLPAGHTFFAATGGFPNPGIWGGFLAVGGFAGVYGWTNCHSNRGRIFISVMSAIVVSAIVLSGSRAAWLGVAGGSIVMLLEKRQFRQWWKHQKRYRVVWLIGSGIFLVMIAIGLYTLRPASVDGRWLIWQVSATIFGQSPLWGGGIGSFESNYMPAQAAWLANHTDHPSTLLAGDTLWAFNEYLRIGCETGMIGLLFLILYLVMAVRAIAGQPAMKRFWLKSTLVALMVFACFSYPFSFLSFQFFAIVWLAFAFRQERKVILSGWGRFAGMVLILFLLVLGGESYLIRYRADRFMARQFHSPDTIVLLNEGNSFYRHLSDSPDFTTSYGRQLYILGYYTEALPILEKGFILRPCSELAGDLGDCYYRIGQYAAAEKAFREGCRMVPGMIVPRYRLFCFYRKSGQREKARRIAEELLHMPVKLVNTRVLAIRKEARKYLTD